MFFVSLPGRDLDSEARGRPPFRRQRDRVGDGGLEARVERGVISAENTQRVAVLAGLELSVLIGVVPYRDAPARRPRIDGRELSVEELVRVPRVRGAKDDVPAGRKSGREPGREAPPLDRADRRAGQPPRVERSPETAREREVVARPDLGL